MIGIETSGFFGFIDPDSRPWSRNSIKIDQYQNGIESALKIAFLTQDHLNIPAGYFLDNPALQRIFYKYRHEKVIEANCFRELSQKCIRIAANESIDSTNNEITEWRDLLNDWAIGSGSKRSQLVYLNCLSKEEAEHLQKLKDKNLFIKSLYSGVYNTYSVDYPEYLDVLNKIKFKRVSLQDFNFDELIRTRLLSGAEKFTNATPVLIDKINDIAEVIKNANIRISRSVLASNFHCQELGVKKRSILTRDEYDSLAPVFGHYHHYAFAHALGSSSFITNVLPTTAIDSTRHLRSEIQNLSDSISSTNGKFYLSLPLSRISFKDIYNLRLGKDADKFTSSLYELHDATSSKNTDIETYNKAVNKHSRFIQQKISLDFTPINLKELNKTLGDTTLPPDSYSPGVILLVVKYAYTFFREFIPNLQKELQLKTFFRKIDP